MLSTIHGTPEQALTFPPGHDGNSFGRMTALVLSIRRGLAPVAQLDGSEGCGEAVQKKQAACQRLPYTSQQLDGLQGLQRSNDARGHPQHTCLAAPSAAGLSWGLRVQAPVAGACTQASSAE